MPLQNKLIHEFGIVDSLSGRTLIQNGGGVVAVAAGTYEWLQLFDPDTYQQITSPVAFTGGYARFAVDGSVTDVDLYGITPEGFSFQVYDQRAQGKTEYAVNNGDLDQNLVVPFHYNNASGDTGIPLPEGSVVFSEKPPLVVVKAADATETLDVGDDADPNGYVSGASIASVGTVAPTGGTLGAYLTITAGAGLQKVIAASQTLHLVQSAGWDTGEGYVDFAYRLVR